MLVRISSGYLLSALAALLLAALAAHVFSREVAQSLRGILSDDAAFEHWSAPDHVSPYSGDGLVDLLTGCIFGLESWKTAFQSRQAVLTVAENCEAEADHALRQHPTLSEAHYLRAYAAYLRNDPETVRRELAQAQRGAPSDQWLAVRRVNLAQKLWPGEAIVGAYALQDDLGLLIASNDGLSVATRLYIRHPQLREMIVASTEPLDDAARLRFLNRLRREVSR